MTIYNNRFAIQSIYLPLVDLRHKAIRYKPKNITNGIKQQK